jgi:hypothetical protein
VRQCVGRLAFFEKKTLCDDGNAKGKRRLVDAFYGLNQRCLEVYRKQDMGCGG